LLGIIIIMDELKTKINSEDFQIIIKEYFIKLIDKGEKNIDDIIEEYNEYLRSYNTWKNIKIDFDNC